MKISVTGRHMSVTDVLKDYTYGKVEHLGRIYDNLQKVDVIINPERDTSYSAEIVVHAPRHSVLVGHASGKTATAAVDIVLEKVERLLTKYKEKLRSKGGRRRGRGSEKTGDAHVPAGDGFGDLWW